MSNERDCWQTPQGLFNQLNKEFHFDIDLCATADNSKCLIYGTDYLHDRYIIQQGSKEKYPSFMPFMIKNKCCFMNPPYSNPKPFIEKAWEDSKHCKIVCLVPNTIKTCKYMDILDYSNGIGTFRKWKIGLTIRDLSRRTQFKHATLKSSSASFGCMLLIMDRRQDDSIFSI